MGAFFSLKMNVDPYLYILLYVGTFCAGFEFLDGVFVFPIVNNSMR